MFIVLQLLSIGLISFIQWLRPEFLSLSTVAILDWIILCCRCWKGKGDCPVFNRMFISVSDFTH